MRVFGHPLHAVLVTFPLGLLTLVPVWDALAWLGVSGASAAAYLGQIAGVVGGLLAAVTGSIDFVRAKKTHAIEKVGLWPKRHTREGHAHQNATSGTIVSF
jgi:uncharacterized membrane protein